MAGHGELEAGARGAWERLAPAIGERPAARRLSVLRSRTANGQGRIVCVLAAPGRPDLVLKHAPHETSRRFAMQIEAHRRAEEVFADAPGLSVPRLLAHDVAARSIVMERAAGLTAHDAMLMAPDGAARLAILGACGRWAGHLHAAGPVRFAPLRPGPILRRVRQWQAAARAGTLDVAAPAAFLRLADQTLAEGHCAAGRRGVLAPAHGDLSLRNLVIGPRGEVTGLDFGTTEVRPPARDLARLLVGHATFFGPVDESPGDGLRAARATLLDAQGRRWRDRAGLDLAMMADLLMIWRSIPAAPRRRGIVHHRRWQGIRRMAASLRAEGPGALSG